MHLKKMQKVYMQSITIKQLKRCDKLLAMSNIISNKYYWISNVALGNSLSLTSNNCIVQIIYDGLKKSR